MPITAMTAATLDKPHKQRVLSELVLGLHDTARSADTHELRLEMLKAALQGAVTLEFSTLPPYLTALWSIKDNRSEVANSIREVSQEEMLHMALACNMLTGLGGTPDIRAAVPRYPGKLPMNVHPDLTVGLSGLNDDVLRAFMEIERPAHPGHFESLEAADELVRAEAAEHDSQKDDFTIGEFYNALLIAFREANPVFHTTRQITGPLSWFVVENLADVERAIDTIETQGEGSEGSPSAAVISLAHYYRFAEVLERKKLVQDPKTGEWAFSIPIEFDLAADVLPVGAAPPGGYDAETAPDPEARRLLHRFNATYSHLVDLLDAAWRTEGGQAQLWHGIDTMFELEKYALPLMQIARPDGLHYGPDFRYLPVSEREPRA
jgi:hypothetical protein